LQAKLSIIGDQIGKIGIYCAIVTVLASIINLVIFKIINTESIFSLDTLNSLIKFMIIGITVIVVAVPEGLPLAVTISLAYSVMKMKDE
jgi:magnesium-transporting ATPase (P-type)